MIIEALCDFVFWIVNFLFSWLEVPNLPDGVEGYLEQFFNYLEVGAGIFANYVPFEYLMTLFGCIVAIDIAIYLYHFIMWILEKIPVLDIDR